MTGAFKLAERIRVSQWVRRVGAVTRVTGSAIESDGPPAGLGEMCKLDLKSGAVLAEVVGFTPDRLVLMPYGDLTGCEPGRPVVATGEYASAYVGTELLGRVVDGFGRCLESNVLMETASCAPLYPEAINPLERGPVAQVMETGIKAMDALLPIGRGQRIGVFAGSGVGKSTLLSMLARYVKADISVIALIGERGREVKAFVDELTPQDRARTVVVAATSDQPSLVRRRAAFFATAIAESFRNRGLHVNLLMDSVTRVAVAQREIGLVAGELPTARGYTPSVFTILPKLLERGGVRAAGGSLTAIYTVLVEADDMNDPIADSVRAILDGHIVLSREIAHRGRYPSIDILQSVSRLAGTLVSKAERQVATNVVKQLATYESARDLIEVGAYKKGSQPTTDRAIELYPVLEEYLTQDAAESWVRDRACEQLKTIMERPTCAA